MALHRAPLAAFILLALAAPSPLLAQRDPAPAGADEERGFTVLGLESADDENEGSEPDVRFARPLRRTLGSGKVGSGATSGGGGRAGGGTGGSTTPLAAHANAGEILDGLIRGLRELEVDVQLIGGRKYMLNDCLGIKVSAGGFEMALGDTTGRFEGDSLVIETEIDKISVSVVKIRIRPNPNILEVCKFSKKFEYGGDIEDVRLTLVFDPVTNAEQNRIVGIGQPKVTVRIGNVNLKPLQNDLDKMAKNAVEDGLTTFLNIQFIDLVNEGLRRLLDPGAAVTAGRGLFEGAEGTRRGSGASAGSGASGSVELERRIAELERRIAELEERLGGSEAGSAATANGGSAPAGAEAGRGVVGRPERARAPVDSKSYEVVDAPELKGRLGRLILAFPEGTTELNVTTKTFEAGTKKTLRTDYGPFAIELTPGVYDLDLGGRVVVGVPIEPKRDTKLRAGVLRLLGSENTTFRLFEPGAAQPFGTWYGTKEIGLPPGPIEVEVNGKRETVTIVAGAIAEY